MNALQNIGRAMDFLALQNAKVRWRSPRRCAPYDGTYILILQKEEGGWVCTPGSYANGSYWFDAPWLKKPIEMKTIAAWSYYPGEHKNQ